MSIEIHFGMYEALWMVAGVAAVTIPFIVWAFIAFVRITLDDDYKRKDGKDEQA